MTSPFLLVGIAALEKLIKLIYFAAATLQYHVWDRDAGRGVSCV